MLVGLFFNKGADSCDYARNVVCKKKSGETGSTTTKAPPITAATSRTTRISSSTASTTTTTTTSTPEPILEEEDYDEEEYEDEEVDEEEEDPQAIKELINLIKKLGTITIIVRLLQDRIPLHVNFITFSIILGSTPYFIRDTRYYTVHVRTVYAHDRDHLHLHNTFSGQCTAVILRRPPILCFYFPCFILTSSSLLSYILSFLHILFLSFSHLFHPSFTCFCTSLTICIILFCSPLIYTAHRRPNITGITVTKHQAPLTTGAPRSDPDAACSLV